MFDIFVGMRVRTVVQIPVHISTPQQTILLSISRLFLLYLRGSLQYVELY